MTPTLTDPLIPNPPTTHCYFAPIFPAYQEKIRRAGHLYLPLWPLCLALVAVAWTQCRRARLFSEVIDLDQKKMPKTGKIKICN